ncbi:MAG: hypothetical protein IPM29_28205 [Planctomycetes bacterium]|nr:hypothetical protein [Planctomycetota bacterium]
MQRPAIDSPDTSAAATGGPDDSDLERLLLAHMAPLWRYLRCLGCQPAEADDLAQETFVAALAHGVERLPRARARGWLRTVARNAWR